MGIKIASIENGVIRNIALEVNKDGDEQISGAEELKLFQRKCATAVKNNICKPEDVEKVMKSYQVQISNVKNAYLQELAQRNEINMDGNEFLDGNELKSFVEASQGYLESSFASEEELEEATEGFYDAKTLGEKATNVAARVGGAFAGTALGVGVGRVVTKKGYYPLMRKLADTRHFENVLTKSEQVSVKFNGVSGYYMGKRVFKSGVCRGAVGLGLSIMALGAYLGSKLAGKAMS